MKFVVEINNAELSKSPKCKTQKRTIKSSCLKMTDHTIHLNGDVNKINGNISPTRHNNNINNIINNSRDIPNNNNINNSDLESASSALGGGRLKFFKDGKFILELSHRKEGERTCWTPVPKKTYWPAVGTPRTENSASLSVSDDNSSVQSSPWQRDHCWKQTLPHKNISQPLQFYLQMSHKKYESTKAIRKKRRRPWDPCYVEMKVKRDKDIKEDSSSSSSNAASVKIKTEPKTKPKLEHIIKLLSDRTKFMNDCSPPRHEIVTLRKRILRELEKVKLEDVGGSKRRAKTSQVSSVAAAAVSTSKPISSHSISSILARDNKSSIAMPDERECSPSFLRTLLKSPQSDSADSRPSSSSSRPPSAHAQHPPTAHLPILTPTPIAPLVYHPSLIHPQSSFYSVIPPSYNRGSTPLWTAQNMHRTTPITSLPLYHNGYIPIPPFAQSPCFGPPLTHSTLHGGYIKQEETSDVPLNLSKNAG